MLLLLRRILRQKSKQKQKYSTSCFVYIIARADTADAAAHQLISCHNAMLVPQRTLCVFKSQQKTHLTGDINFGAAHDRQLLRLKQR